MVDFEQIVVVAVEYETVEDCLHIEVALDMEQVVFVVVQLDC